MKVVFFAEPPQNGDGSLALQRGFPYAWSRRFVAVLAALLLLSLLGAERVEAVPSVTYKCSPAPQNCYPETLRLP